jgi:hypothetical protein
MWKGNYTSLAAEGKRCAGRGNRSALQPKKETGHSRTEWPIIEVANDSLLLRLCVRIASLRCAVLLLRCVVLLLRCAPLLLG